MDENVKGFMLFSDQKVYVDMLSTEQKASLLDALYEFSTGQEPELEDKLTQMAFMVIKQSIVRAWKKSETLKANASKPKQKKDGISKPEQNEADGSKTKQNSANESKAKQTEAKRLNDTDTDSDTDTDTDNRESTPPPSKRPPLKSPHGQFGTVMLTEEEHDKLVEQFGLKGADDMIQRLDEYIASKGVKYKSHYATILAWKRKDSEQPARTAQPYRESLTEHNKAVAAQVCAELEAADSPF